MECMEPIPSVSAQLGVIGKGSPFVSHVPPPEVLVVPSELLASSHVRFPKHPEGSELESLQPDSNIIILGFYSESQCIH